MIGGLMYASTLTRPDIAFSVNHMRQVHVEPWARAHSRCETNSTILEGHEASEADLSSSD
eukprot:1921088-Rhodomonas_salina.1